MFKTLVCKIILTYQRVISPTLGLCCRFHPTCSQYTLEAVELHGPVVGLTLGLLRLLRCNPIFSGGFDPVPLSWRCEPGINIAGTDREDSRRGR